MVSPEEHIQEFVEVTQPNKSFEEITKVNRTDGDVHIHFEMGTDSVTEISYARLTEDDDEYTVAEFEIQGQNEDDSQTSDGTDVDSPIDRLRQYLDTSYPESDLEEVTNLERTGDTTHIHVDVTDESGTEQYYAMITEDDDTYRIEEFKTV